EDIILTSTVRSSNRLRVSLRAKRPPHARRGDRPKCGGRSNLSSPILQEMNQSAFEIRVAEGIAGLGEFRRFDTNSSDQKGVSHLAKGQARRESGHGKQGWTV